MADVRSGAFWCSHAHTQTVIYYLNGEGSTWFPLASSNGNEGVWRPRNRAEALEIARSSRSGDADAAPGIVLSPDRGDAVAFYNLLDDGGTSGDGTSAVDDGRLGSVDLTTLHAGMPAPRTKWIGTHWFRIGGAQAGRFPPAS